MMSFDVEVTQIVRVALDETKFDDAFMEEFRAGFYPFDTIQDHAEHIAQLEARGLIETIMPGEFIEGYGIAKDMGITASVVETDIGIAS